MAPGKTFNQNVELDARCVAAAMQGGATAMLAVALRSGCPAPSDAMARAEWLKTQPKDYIDKVCAKVDELLPKSCSDAT